MKPNEIASRLQISTSALRHYESWGIVPPVERSPNGYRVYTDAHIAYFVCIRAMQPGFGMQTTSEILRKLVAGETADALWTVSSGQAKLHRDMQIAEKTIRALSADAPEPPVARKGRRSEATIGQAAEETGIPASAIRHWEKMGLIELERDPDNGYRKIPRAQIRRLLVIRTLKSAVWSLDVIREVLEELDLNDVGQAQRMARESLKYLNELNRLQIRGIAALQRVLEASGLSEPMPL